MHKTSAEAEQLATGIVEGMAHVGGVEVILCPPFPYLALVGKIVSGSTIALGGQNMYPEKEGAFTGEVSPSMLLDVGCKFVILGHSERRHTMGETDTFINQKVRLALDCGLDMILCVGETMAERTAHQTESVIDRQLSLGLANVPAQDLTRQHCIRACLGDRKCVSPCHSAASGRRAYGPSDTLWKYLWQ
jgi:triosephosphate isomerase